MSTFLALCQRVASESGTINGTFPTTVTAQTGRLAKVVRWTNDAWRSIQNAHGEWRWMRSDFSGPTVAGTRSYSGSDFSLTRLGEWMCRGEDEDRYSIYLTATGVADERPLIFVEYDTFFTTFMRGTQTNDYPTHFTITPDNKIALHPIPDAVYTVRGPYRKSPQELTADADEPEMPARFHHLIADLALDYLGTHDEAVLQIPLWRLRRMAGFSDLERDQLPRITLAGALA
jgi:hypothetical protein